MAGGNLEATQAHPGVYFATTSPLSRHFLLQGGTHRSKGSVVGEAVTLTRVALSCLTCCASLPAGSACRRGQPAQSTVARLFFTLLKAPYSL